LQADAGKGREIFANILNLYKQEDFIMKKKFRMGVIGCGGISLI
jgi:hypothetical protein